MILTPCSLVSDSYESTRVLLPKSLVISNLIN